MDEGDEIVPGSNRGLHRRRRRHNYFGKARQAAFLGHLAATCNVTASAAAAGVSVSAVYAHRMKDGEFRALWQVALEQGYARLEAALIERAARPAKRLEVPGGEQVSGAEAPDEIEWERAMQLLRHHQRGLGGMTRRGRPVPVRVPVEAVAKRIVAKLKALGVRPGAAGGPRQGEGAKGGEGPEGG